MKKSSQKINAEVASATVELRNKLGVEYSAVVSPKHLDYKDGGSVIILNADHMLRTKS